MLNWIKRKLNPQIVDKKFNLLIIGAQKGGTTSLHTALSQHPTIFMTNPIKEPGFFLPFEVMQKYYNDKGLSLVSKNEYLAKYLLKGYKGEKYFGESSTFYTSYKWSSSELVQSIKTYNSEMKIIFVYRDRIDRIISHFFHEKYKNDQLTFDTFLKNPEAFGISCYFKRLEPFINVFSNEQILILQFEEMIKSPTEVMKTIFDFLEVDASKATINFPKKNQRKIKEAYDLENLKEKIINHKRYSELLEDEKYFQSIINNYTMR